MPIEWRTTTIRKGRTSVKVIHWPKHDPRALINAVKSTPKLEAGEEESQPKVHAFGKYALAVRKFQKGREKFEKLRRLAKAGVAIVEMPVALIEEQRAPHKLITIWKKGLAKQIEGATELKKFLTEGSRSQELREKACLSAARQLAKLHAAGFAHGHPHYKNFVVNERGDAKLVDGKFVVRLTKEDRDNDLIFLRDLAAGTPVDPLNLHSKGIQSSFPNRLIEEYERQYAKSTAQRRRRT